MKDRWLRSCASMGCVLESLMRKRLYIYSKDVL
nr:MAG TPA: hypothetical protein [Caudoviricetes sp.]